MNKYILLFLMISTCGGFLLSITGLSIGWMLGTLIAAMILSFARPSLIGTTGMPKSWLYTGQLLLGIELGQKINLSVLNILRNDWAIIFIVLLSSVLFSLLAGMVLWKWSQTDMITSFFSTAPGGLSAMPGIAEEVGANTAVVSILQTMRVFLVIFIVPSAVSLFVFSPDQGVALPIDKPVFQSSHLFWTAAVIAAAYAGYYTGKKMKFPAPWLLGSMLATAIVQSAASAFTGHSVILFWPHEIMIASQVFIAASLGSRFQKSMFTGLAKTIAVSLVSTLLFIGAMLSCSYLVSITTGLPLVTAALAFAPGGIAEMAVTAAVLNADTTFVVAVQVLRVIAVILILPPLFKMIHTRKKRAG